MTPEHMVDTPSPFAPTEELQAFLKAMEEHPDRSAPEIKRAVAEVRGYLWHRTASSKAP